MYSVRKALEEISLMVTVLFGHGTGNFESSGRIRRFLIKNNALLINYFLTHIGLRLIILVYIRLR